MTEALKLAILKPFQSEITQQLLQEHGDVKNLTKSPDWIEYAENFYHNIEETPPPAPSVDPRIWEHVKRHVLHLGGRSFPVPPEWKLGKETKPSMEIRQRHPEGSHRIQIKNIEYFRLRRQGRTLYLSRSNELQFSSQLVTRRKTPVLVWRSQTGRFRSSPYRRDT